METLDIKNRNQFREWLMLNATKEKECWLNVKRGEPINPNVFYYLEI